MGVTLLDFLVADTQFITNACIVSRGIERGDQGKAGRRSKLGDSVRQKKRSHKLVAGKIIHNFIKQLFYESKTLFLPH